MAGTSSEEKDLTRLLERLNNSKSRRTAVELSSIEVRLLAQSLVPSASRSTSSLAFLCLSQFVDNVNKSKDNDPDRNAAVTSSFSLYLLEVFKVTSDVDLNPPSFIPFTCLLSSLFPLQPSAAVSLLTTPLEETKEGSDDALAILLEAAELTSPLQPCLAEMLSQGAGTKAGRDLIRSRAEEWLSGAMTFKDIPELNVLASVALSKLGRDEQPGQDQDDGRDQKELCGRMMDFIKSGASSSQALLPALEGLSILSLKGTIKEKLARDRQFLQSLLALSPMIVQKPGSLPVTPRGSMDFEPKYEAIETGLCYGITTILLNLTSKKPLLTAEEQQMAKLKAMAASGKRDGGEIDEDPLESDQAVKERVELVIQAGAIGALRGLARAESRLVKEDIGKLCLNLLEEPTYRLSFVRDGGFKALLSVVESASTVTDKVSQPNSSGVSKNILSSYQALAKLIITTPPHLLFPPPHLTTCLDALTPMYHLLTSHESTSLQRFESLMALTNLASIDPSIGSRIIQASITPLGKVDSFLSTQKKDQKVKVLGKVEELILDENKLVRRASTQLVCNLVSSPAGFAEFSGQGIITAKMAARLHVLLIMANVDDLPTQLAAGGALAIITDSPEVCKCLFSGEVGSKESKPVWHRIMSMFEPPDLIEEDGESIPVISNDGIDPDIIHRAAVILHNLVEYAIQLDCDSREVALQEARESGVENKLMSLLGNRLPIEVLQPIVECLKLLKRYPA